MNVADLRKDTVFRFADEDQQYVALRSPDPVANGLEITYTAYPSGFAKHKVVEATLEVELVTQL